MSKVFVTGDNHFFHNNILKYCNRYRFLVGKDLEYWENNGRKFHDGRWKENNYKISDESVQYMNECLINSINSNVSENDILFNLGDFVCGSKDYYNDVKNILSKINCKNIIMIWGNHDKPHKIHNLFKESYDLLNTVINKTKVTLCHYAMAIWNKSHHKAIHLYGHSHGSAEGWLDTVMPGRRSLDVGVDNAFKLLGEYRPFEFSEILKILNNREGFYFDHHLKTTY